MNIDGYTDFELLGKGALGSTYKALKEETKEYVRLKLINLPDGLSSEQLSTIKDIFFKQSIKLRKLNDKHSLIPMHAGRIEAGFFIESKLVKGMSLFEFLSDQPREIHTHIFNIFFSILETINNYHQNNIFHGNIKLSNVILDQSYQPFLADAAVSSIYEFLFENGFGQLTDKRYLSAPILEGDSIQKEDDLFSITVLFYRCLVGHYPFSDIISENIRKGKYTIPSQLKTMFSENVDEFFKLAFSSDKENSFKDVNDFKIALENLQKAGITKSQASFDDQKQPTSRQIIPSILNGNNSNKPRFILWFGLPVIILIIATIAFYSAPENTRQLIINKFIRKKSEVVAKTKKVSKASSKVVPTKKVTHIEKKYYFTLKTKHEGVDVFQNETYIGKTPFTVKSLKAGDYQYYLHKPGYLSKKVQISVGKGKETEGIYDIIKNPIPSFVLPGNNWTSFLRDNFHTGYIKTDIVMPPKVKWKIQLKAAETANPVIRNGIIYIASKKKYLSLFRLRNGTKIKSRFQKNQDARSTPIVTNKYIFLAGHDGMLKAFDLKRFKKRGEISALGSVFSAPTLNNNILFVVSASGTIAAFDAKPRAFKRVKFKKLWDINPGERFSSSPAIYDNHEVLISSFNNLYSLNIKDGSTLWAFFSKEKPLKEKSISGENNSFRLATDDFDFLNPSPCICGKTIIFSSSHGNIYGLNPKTGKQQWKYIAKGEIVATPVCSKGMAYIASKDGYIYAFDVVNGILLYKINVGSPIYSSPVIASSLLIVGDDNGIVSFYKKQNGEKIAEIKLEGKFRSTPAISNGAVVFVSTKGIMYLIK